MSSDDGRSDNGRSDDHDVQEFMDEVIKPGQPDGISLPQLPYYQEYGYDEKQHKLIILEYPERKAQFEKQPVE